MISEQLIFTSGWASWGSIIAGGFTTVAIAIIMAILGAAMGFAMIKPKSDDPVAGMGIAWGGWSAFTVLLSLACGGFLAGLFAGQRGAEHGFMVWAVVTVACSCLSSMVIGSAFRMIGSAARGIGNGAASAVTVAGKGAATLASSAIDELRENISLDIDTDAINEKVRGILKDTGVDNLQPEYLQGQIREAKADFRNLIHQLIAHPSEYDRILGSFITDQKKRLDGLTEKVDKQAAINALMRNRNIPEDEARMLVDDAMAAYDHAVDKAREAYADAQDQVEDAKKRLHVMAEQARAKADEMAGTAAKAALIAAAALILGAVVSALAGYWGASCAADWLTLNAATISR